MNMDKSTKDGFQSLLQDSRQQNSRQMITNRLPWQTKMATLELLEFAKVLAKAPAVLVLDEPTAALDARAAGRVHAALKHEVAQGAVTLPQPWAARA